MDIPTKAVQFIAGLSKSASLVNPDVVIATVADQDAMFALSGMAQTLRDGARIGKMRFFVTGKMLKPGLQQELKEKWD